MKRKCFMEGANVSNLKNENLKKLVHNTKLKIECGINVNEREYSSRIAFTCNNRVVTSE